MSGSRRNNNNNANNNGGDQNNENTTTTTTPDNNNKAGNTWGRMKLAAYHAKSRTIAGSKNTKESIKIHNVKQSIVDRKKAFGVEYMDLLEKDNVTEQELELCIDTARVDVSILQEKLAKYQSAIETNKQKLDRKLGRVTEPTVTISDAVPPANTTQGATSSFPDALPNDSNDDNTPPPPTAPRGDSTPPPPMATRARSDDTNATNPFDDEEDDDKLPAAVVAATHLQPTIATLPPLAATRSATASNPFDDDDDDDDNNNTNPFDNDDEADIPVVPVVPVEAAAASTTNYRSAYPSPSAPLEKELPGDPVHLY